MNAEKHIEAIKRGMTVLRVAVSKSERHRGVLLTEDNVPAAAIIRLMKERPDLFEKA